MKIIRRIIISFFLFAPFCFANEAARLDFPIGIATLGGGFTELIPSGVELPQKFTDVFANAEDGQQTIKIHISQKIEDEVKTVSQFDVSGFPPKPKGMLRLKLTLLVNEKKELFIYIDSVGDKYSQNWGPFTVK